MNGRRIRRSLDTRNWEVATLRLEEMESGNPAKLNLEDAWGKFLADCEARNLTKPTLGKFKLLRRETATFFGTVKLDAVDANWLDEFRQSWGVSPITAVKKLERLKSFFRFCHDRRWITENPARVLKPPRVKIVPKMPFTKEEMGKILDACDRYPAKGIYGEANGKRLRAMTLLLRYSGLRIRDAACLRVEALKEGNLFLRTQKTGAGVFVPLPDFVVKALKSVERGGFFFWSGQGDPKSTVGDWQRSFRKLFKLAGVKGNPHRFQTTFAVSLLEAGVPLEQVAVLLGNSVKICERHYAPWVKSRQDALAVSVRQTWPR